LNTGNEILVKPAAST